MFDKALASLKLQDYEQYVLSMEHGDANWILDFSVIIHVSRNPKFLDEIKSVVGSSQIKSINCVYHNAEGKGHARV